MVTPLRPPSPHATTRYIRSTQRALDLPYGTIDYKGLDKTLETLQSKCLETCHAYGYHVERIAIWSDGVKFKVSISGGAGNFKESFEAGGKVTVGTVHNLIVRLLRFFKVHMGELG